MKLKRRMLKMKTKKIYQFKDVYQYFGSTGTPLLMYSHLIDVCDAVYKLTQLGIKNDFLSQCSWAKLEGTTWYVKKHALDLLKVLVPKYFQMACTTIDEDADNLEIERMKKEFFNNFLNVIEMHWDYYDTLLSYYDEEKANLLRQVQSTTSISSVRNTTDGGTSSTNTSSNGTTGGTDTLTLNTKEEIDNTHNNTGKDTKETTYASGVSNGRSTTGSVEAISTLKDTPQIMLTDTDDYNSNRTDTSTDTSETVSESSSKSGKDTDETTYASGFTDDNEVKRTGTETTTHSGTTGTQEASTTTDSRNHSDAYSDTHTTNEDRDTLMARIAEIQENYKSLIMEYAMKFKDLFWSVMNYEE